MQRGEQKPTLGALLEYLMEPVAGKRAGEPWMRLMPKPGARAAIDLGLRPGPMPS